MVKAGQLSRSLRAWCGELAVRFKARLLAHPFDTAVRLLAFGFALDSASAFTRIVAGRLGFPYDLEWMEGGLVDHVARVLRGEPLYVEPSLGFIPFVYNPLFYWLGALSSSVVGLGPPALRVVSVAAVIALVVGIVEIVRREGESLFSGILAAACYLATYELSGGWMDVARVDSTFIALQVLAVLAAIGRTRMAPVLSASLVCLAFLAKQYAVVCAGPIALYFLLDRDWKSSAVFCVSASVALVGAVLALDWSSGGWYSFWTIQVPRNHASRDYRVGDVLQEHVLEPVPLLMTVAVVGAIALVAREIQRDDRTLRVRAARPTLVIGFAAVLLAEAWASYNHAGSYLNCLMPAYVALSLLAGFGIASSVGGAVSASALTPLLAIVIQLWSLRYEPERWVPSTADRREGAKLEERLRNANGSVLYAFRGFFGTSGANPSHAHQMAISDLLQIRAHRPDLARQIEREAEEHFALRLYYRVVLDNPDYVLKPALERHYRRVSETPVGRGPFWTRSGPKMKPRIVYERSKVRNALNAEEP